MSWAILGLSAGFILVTALLYFVLLKSTQPLWIKSLTLVLVTLFYWVQYEALQQYAGWPSTDDLPEAFILIATDIQEPDLKRGVEGVMYWWVRDDRDPQAPPRVYQLPYEPQLHETTEQVIEEQKKGSVYIARKQPGGAGGNGLGVSFDKVSKANRFKKP
ncbi:MAG: hypothetical protein QNJ69_05225 [Gammaproteobacteria bacterium]|nr:hypothetical protein [Gammaproteobacteria bacterium]